MTAIEAPLRVLLVEDSPADAELLLRELRRLGRPLEHERVTSRLALDSALERFDPDIILSDYSMPGFSGFEALEIAVTRAPHTPFVFVSGTIGEERAIEALQQGATDYVLKENLRRLPTAVERALRVARERVEREEMQRSLQKSEERFRHLVESSRDWIWEHDTAMCLRYSNEALTEILGYRPEELEGRRAIELLLDEDRRLVERRLPELHAKREGWWRWRLRWRHRDGSSRVLESSGGPFFDETGALAGYRGIDHDVTEQLRQEARIRQLARIHAVVGALGTSILRTRNLDELMTNACRISVEYGGYVVAAIGRRDSDDVLRLAKADGVRDVLDVIAPRSAVGLSPEDAAFEHLCVKAFRTRQVVLEEDFSRSGLPAEQRALMESAGICSEICIPIGAQPWGVLALYSAEARTYDEEEIALLRRLADEIDHAIDFIGKSERLEYLAFHNTVTGLPNRVAFQNRLHDLIAQGPVVAVAICIHKFGRVNSTRGRAFGDALLVEVGQRLQHPGGGHALVGHADLDRFIVAYPMTATEEEEAAHIESWIRQLEANGFVVHGEQVHVGLRAGLAFAPLHGKSAEEAERNAMAALDEASESGSVVHPYSPAVGRRATRRVELERDLRAAIEEDRFELFYQPKFDALTRRMTGAEALIRWRHPTAGLVSPAEFIPVLEDTGLIVPVGQWVLRDALRAALEWRKACAGCRIAVNVSARELRDPAFLERCEELLGPHADDQPIDIEITESVLMDEVEHSIRLLERLRKLGCRIAIDDFGTGYSSLNYLVRLPVDTLKIDRSFINAIADSPETVTLITNVINLAHSLRLDVVAEGVEDEQQARMLRLLRCDQLQGYLLGSPMPAGAFGTTLLGL